MTEAGSGARYDLWLTDVRDAAAAMDALTEELGDRARARDAVLSMPTMLRHGASDAEVDALRTRLLAVGLTLEARPTRRSVAHAPPAQAPVPAVSSAVPGTSSIASAPRPLTPAPALSTGAPVNVATPALAASAQGTASAELGVAKVSFHAALVAAPAYVLQGNVVVAIVGLTVLGVVSAFPSLTGSLLVALLGPLAVSALRFSVFSLIVRRSREGHTDLRLSEDDLANLGDLLLAGLRFLFVTIVAFTPFVIWTWASLPKLIGFFIPAARVGGGEFALVLLVMLVTLLLPLVALPGAYAAAALGSGCSGVNPAVGLVVARRIPGPYFLTLAYLASLWFASVALMMGGSLALATTALRPESGAAGGVVSLFVALGVTTLLDVTVMLVSARVLGLLMYHYREELGL